MATLFFLGMYPRMEVNSLVPREAPVPFPVRIHAKARKAPPLTTAVVRSAASGLPCAGGLPPQRPPSTTCLVDLVPTFATGVQSKVFRQTTSRQFYQVPVGAGLVPALARPQKVTFPYPLESPVGAGLVPAQDRRQVPPSHLTLLAPNWITRFFEQPRGFTAFAENTVLCVSAEADLVRQEYGRACRIHRARMPGCVRGPGSDQLCGEYLLHAPTRP